MVIITRVKKTAFTGLMLALIILLSALEHMLPPMPLLPPNVRLGLSNVVTMYCVFFLGKGEAVTLNSMKSAFVVLMRGPVAGFLSISGGMLSIAAVIFLVLVFKERLSYVSAAITGAVFHNIGQLLAFAVIMKTAFAFYYFPVLLVSGVVLGIVTGTVLRILLPILNKILNGV